MNGNQFQRECERVGLSIKNLAAALEIPPGTIEEWKRSAVPARYSREVEWHIVAAERDAALARSGLPGCEWMQRWEAAYDASVHLPTDSKFEEELAEMRAHPQSCDVCTRREQFLLDEFGPMPDYPSARWVDALVEVADVFGIPREWRRVAFIAAVLTVLCGIALLIWQLPRSAPLSFVAFLSAFAAAAILIVSTYGGMKSLHGSALGRWLARCAAGIAGMVAFDGMHTLSGYPLTTWPEGIVLGAGGGILVATLWPLFEAIERARSSLEW